MKRLLPLLLASACTTIGPGHAGVLWHASRRHPEPGLQRGAPPGGPVERDVHLRPALDEPRRGALRHRGQRADHPPRRVACATTSCATRWWRSTRRSGPKYYEKILEPVLRSEARRVFGRYTPEEIYSTKRDVIEREIRSGVHQQDRGASHRPRGDPHPRRRAAGGDPRRHRSEARRRAGGAEDEVRARRSRAATAEQKQIEAKAIADYNRIIAASLSPAILDFERIQQMTQLATSPNAKTVVIGDGQGRLLLTAPVATPPQK